MVEATEGGQFLTFALIEETFAVEVAKVLEILDVTSVTKVPQMPEYMRGVINLRGHVVPVIDLRLRFGMPSVVDTVNTCIIVVEVAVGEETTVLGALADSVQEVVDLEGAQIEPVPLITKLETEFLKGMGKHNDRFLIILDIDRLFYAKELEMVQSEEEQAA